MSEEFTAFIERDGEWLIGRCPEVTRSNRQGTSEEECAENLGQAIEPILEDRREGR